MELKPWISIVLLGTGLFAGTVHGAEDSEFELPSTNPRAVVQQRVAATDIEVTYNRPSVRDRVIFGALVPFDQVWRTGADQATRISFGTPVTFGDTLVTAGDYELFTIPGQKEWVVILQKAQSQWGSYAYDLSHDLARVPIQPIQLQDRVESFTISLDDIKTDQATLNISWDRVRVPVPIRVDVAATVLPQLEATLEGDGRKPYFQAAMFYYDNGLDYARAAELMHLALERNPDHVGMLYRLALILEQRNDRAGATAAAERSLAQAESQGPELRAEYERLNALLLARLRGGE